MPSATATTTAAAKAAPARQTAQQQDRHKTPSSNQNRKPIPLLQNFAKMNTSSSSTNPNFMSSMSMPPSPAALMSAIYNTNPGATANVTSMLQAAGYGRVKPKSITEQTHILARELECLMEKAQTLAIETGDHSASTREAVAEIQIQTARMLRQVLPTNKDLLHFAQDKNWIPLLINWMNLHESPSVQVEALLALTTIAELCQQAYNQHATEGAMNFGMMPNNISQLGGTTDSRNFDMATNPHMFPFHHSMSHNQMPFHNTHGHPMEKGPSGNDSRTEFSSGGTHNSFVSKKIIFGNIQQQQNMAAGASNMPPFHSGWVQQQHMTMMTGQISSFPPFSLSTPPVPLPNDNGGTPSPLSIPPHMINPLSSSSQNLLFRHSEAIPTLISLLTSPNKDVHEQAMWILGSFAAGEAMAVPGSLPNNNMGPGGPIHSDSNDKGPHNMTPKEAILAAGVMEPLISCLEASPDNISLQRIGSWAISNLVESKMHQGKGGNKGAPAIATSSDHPLYTIKMRLLMPTIIRLLSSPDADTLSYICWALSHLCDGPTTNITYVVTYPTDTKGGLVPKLVQLLAHPNWKVIKPALRTIGNIVCAEIGDETNNFNHPADWTNSDPAVPCDFTNVIVDCEAVPKLKALIAHGNREIQKEACWTLSNIAAGITDQIQAVIDSGAITPLVKLINDKNTDQEVRSEACWVVLNATSCGTDKQVEMLVAEGCVSVLSFLLEESSMVTMALEGLERVLQVEENREYERKSKVPSVVDDNTPSPLVSASMIQKALEKHNNSNAVSKRANRIWKQHFVSCALCNQSFSRHRGSDVKFCSECKCHVCSRCNCEVYHLTYQEELWAASEEQNEASKQAKKSKKQKKKEKRKEKKVKQQDVGKTESSSQPQISISDIEKKVQRPIEQGNFPLRSRSSTYSSSSESASIANVAVGTESNSKIHRSRSDNLPPRFPSEKKVANYETNTANIPSVQHMAVEGAAKTLNPSMTRSESDYDHNQPPVDFVLYLQQTGSIIALARLMDALDCGAPFGAK